MEYVECQVYKRHKERVFDVLVHLCFHCGVYFRNLEIDCCLKTVGILMVKDGMKN